MQIRKYLSGDKKRMNTLNGCGHGPERPSWVTVTAFLAEIKNSALAGVAQGIEHWSTNQRVAGLIPQSGHMPGLQARSPVGSA